MVSFAVSDAALIKLNAPAASQLKMEEVIDVPTPSFLWFYSQTLPMFIRSSTLNIMVGQWSII